MVAQSYAPLGPSRHHPENWKSGPDRVRHEQYYAWLKHRAQANYRSEGHELTWHEWCEFWDTDYAWYNRGRGSKDICLTRKDIKLPWSKDNCELITRLEQFQRQGKNKVGRPRGPYKKKTNAQ